MTGALKNLDSKYYHLNYLPMAEPVHVWASYPRLPTHIVYTIKPKFKQENYGLAICMKSNPAKCENSCQK